MTKNNDHSYNEEIIYINPKILTMIGHTQFLEGCGSCMVSDDKYVTGVLDRPYKVEFEYYDLDGNKKNKIIEGFEATVFCHEYDHLNGILHMDRIQKSFVMTLEEMKKYREQHPYSIISENEPFEYK
jgi:peptide deformylase